MIIPTKKQLIENERFSSYNHFNQRLNERYGIDITYYEYKLLHQIPLSVVKKQSKNKVVGYITIKTKLVLVVKDRHKRKLATALPANNFNKKKRGKKDSNT